MGIEIEGGINFGPGIKIGLWASPHPVAEVFINTPFEGFEWTQETGKLRFYSGSDIVPITNYVNSGDIVIGTTVQIDVVTAGVFVTFGNITSIDLSDPGNAIIYVSPPVAVTSGYKSMKTGIKFINS